MLVRSSSLQIKAFLEEGAKCIRAGSGYKNRILNMLFETTKTGSNLTVQ